MDRLYSTPSWRLAIALFVILLVGMFAGFLLGKDAARKRFNHGAGRERNDRCWRGDRSGVFEHCAGNCAHFVICGDHFYWSAGRTFIWPCRAPPYTHGSGFRIARQARGISNPGSRPPRRGVIRENFGPLENLRATMRSALSTAQ